ncbi:MAG TPA: hypothetical protein DEQ03_09110, partial [Marinilabiliales bacterium]|nr:hypothetical protein [Marinilabiliales bacterium]
MKLFFLFLMLGCLYFPLHAQTNKKKIETLKIESPVKMDGKVDEPIWNKVPATDNFIQYEPINGQPSNYRTEVKFLYSDYALYVGALLYDNSPDSIMKQMSLRDEIGQSDFFGISIDPFNDGQSSYTFIVTPENIQFDARETAIEDANWDAVWISEVTCFEQGWMVEMEIPYSALRFPQKEEHTWGLNIVRNVQHSREKSFWNFVDAKINGYVKQSGELCGIKQIDAPIRLSLMPYVSGYLFKNSNSSQFDYSLKGGLDVKYGINESYTLDMMLIPDFGQVESDDKIYNISAFETFYEEKRPFFTEGTELFEKGEIFYSRRIGSVKDYYRDKDYDLQANEEIDYNPTEAPLINVTKITGKGKNGLGVGILNGMAGPARAIIKDTLTGKTRSVQTQPFTNYNVLVFDQSLKNNSNISLSNTNYLQPNSNYVSNVTSAQMRFETKNGKYAFEGVGGISYLDGLDKEHVSAGAYDMNVQKIAGNFKFELSNSLAAKSFDDNDLGYIEKTDEMETSLELDYNFYQPIGYMLKCYNALEFTKTLLFSERAKIGNSIEYNGFTTFRNYLSLNLEAQWVIGNYNDYYEARTDNRLFVRPGIFVAGFYLSPDYRKKFVLDVKGGFWHANSENIKGYWVGLLPIIRFNDRFNLRGGITLNHDINDEGFVDKTENSDTIYMAQRNVRNLINSFTVNYIFNSKMALSMRVRHYWLLINYNEFYTLANNGSLVDEPNFHADDLSRNYFNIDLTYIWRFAPGSELSLVYKNSIENESNNPVFNYRENLSDLWGFEKQNSLSLRVVYYLDYLKLKR